MPATLAHSILPDASVAHPRRVERLHAGQEAMEGAGVRITRLLDGRMARALDPFLMLDSFRSDDPQDYLAGFPDHPHRGFETVTIMIEGRMRHRDSAGHEGLLGDGGVQWMTAGRGLVHSEMPEQQDGRMEGFQLWLNLPAADKLCTPGYRDFTADEIPSFTTAAGAHVRVVAGASHGVDGAVRRPATEPLLLDVTLAPGARFTQPLDHKATAFACLYRGAATIAGTPLGVRTMAILAGTGPAGEPCDGVVVEAPADAAAPARLLLVAGRPLREPIVQYGPFVMNTERQIHEAIADFRAGKMHA